MEMYFHSAHACSWHHTLSAQVDIILLVITYNPLGLELSNVKDIKD